MFLFIDYDNQIYCSLLSLLQVLNCIASSLYIFCNYYILIYILFYFLLLLTVCCSVDDYISLLSTNKEI